MLPFIKIHHLAVRVVTANVADAGTDNEVWFDIGPVGWELLKEGSQFERGADETYGLDCTGLRLTTDDIVRLRLEKKGIGGWTGSPDGSGGDWEVGSLQLSVFATAGKPPEWVSPLFPINRVLNRYNPEWVKDLRPWSTARRFVRTTRLRQNAALTLDQETVAMYTTQVKLAGISGWVDKKLHACATGTVLRTAKSTDGLATIDLELALLDVDEKQGKPRRRYRFGPEHGMAEPRFLRVEYAFTSAPETVPKTGQCVRICGKVKWDTDHEGWYEIHPAGPGDVHVLDKGACDAAGLPKHGDLSLRAALASDFPEADLAQGLRALDPCLGSGSTELSVRALIKSCAF